ncbi:MAG TPA: FAD-dependent oxidoreductase [Gemmatimonadales bacterium]|nr:FAD-dependent oxidoreductase [Gemmatimonadales bacterium]
MKVVVVGAGIAGLAAAWELTQSGGCDVTLLESERRAGGVIVTEQVDGFIVEGGPDGFLAGEPELPALARELGISDHVVRQVARGTTLWTGKALQPIDEGQAAALLGIDAAKAEVAKGFSTFAEGMAEPVAALAQRLAGSLRFAQGVAGIVAEANRWRIAITGGSAHEADGVVLALPAFAAGRLLEAVGVKHARALADVIYAPSITVSLAYREAQLAKPLGGAGFVVESPQQIRACTYASQKFPGRAPDGHVLLRAYLPPMNGDPGVAAHAQLAAILGIRGEPLWSRAFYWDRGLPRYRAHHAEHVAAVRRRLSRLPPIAIAGAGYDGAGVSACVRSGRAAGRLMAQLMAR